MRAALYLSRMIRAHFSKILILPLALLIGCQPAAETEGAPVELAVAEDVRTFNKAPVDAMLSDIVAKADVVGASALVYQGGREVYYGEYGHAEWEEDRLWRRGALVNIYSMTKPVTGVTLMTLYEEGKFELDDPLENYLPEFKDMKVLAGTDENGAPIMQDADHPMTIREVMSHTAGFSYGWGDNLVDQAMNSMGVLNPAKPLSEFSSELASIPLAYQPGTQWKYSVSADVQARLAEVIGGKPYDQLVQERVLVPLGMSETGYYTPHKARVTPVYILEENRDIAREPDKQVYGFFNAPPVQKNGGHGLISTIDDYMRFARMLLNEGELDGVRILKAETVRLMAQDHLPLGITEKDFLPGKGQMGFGLNFAVRIAPPADEMESPGEVGEFFWDGRASTLFWVDPKNDLAAVFFVQIVPFNGELHRRFRGAVYEGLGD